MNSKINFNKRKERVRFKIKSKSNFPRLSVFISNKNIYSFVIDNETNNTLCSSSTKELKINGSNIPNAKLVGEDIAKKAAKLKIKNVVFDKGGYLYHGKVKSLSDAARSNGLNF